MAKPATILLSFALALLALGLPAEAQERPNIIFIMADDLGNADLGYRGGQVISPNLDALAAEGVRLESFYGEPVCTPSRAALMTGRYPMRLGLQTFVIFPSHTYGLPLDERTLPEALRDAGYETWMVGKWHLGHADKKFWPQNRGFDHFYGNVMGEVDYFTRERGGLVDWQRDGQFLKEEGYYTTLIGDEAVKLIDDYDGKAPFFLYFAALAPHAPYEAPENYKALYAKEPDPQRQTYMAMITALDDQVGRIVKAVKRKGIAGKTIILFASDNSGATSGLFASGSKSAEERATEEGGIAQNAKAPASNAPFKGGKGSLYEGGVRVPGIVYWPGMLAPRVVTAPLHMTDVMPTLLALAGGKGDSAHPFDGHDIWGTLFEGAAPADAEVLINAEAFRGAIRVGDWKLVKVALLPGRTELYNVVTDPGETTDVAATNPLIVADLEARLLAYAAEQKPSEWLKAQPAFVGAQGKAIFDADYDIGEDGLPTEKPALPAE
jgi:arylsulfatase A-like enzyme